MQIQLLIDAPGLHSLDVCDAIGGKAVLSLVAEGSRSSNISACVSLLLDCHKSGRDVGLDKLDKFSRPSRSPLMYAAKACLYEVVNMLLNAGANVNLAGSDGKVC